MLDYESEMVESEISAITGRGIMNSHEKIDIEMGSTLAEDGNSNLPIPELLRNFHFDHLEGMRFADEEGQLSYDPFFSGELDMIDSARTSVATVINFVSIKPEDGLEESAQRSHIGDEVRESAQMTIDTDGRKAIKETDDKIE